MSIKTLPTLTAGIAFLGAALAIAAWPEGENVNPQPRSAGSPVKVAVVDHASSSRKVSLTGVVRAAERARLSFTAAGRLARRPVQVGDTVVADQVLAELDRQQAELAKMAAASTLAEIEIRLAQAEKDLARVVRLAAAEAATDEEVEQVVTTTRALDAARRSAAVGLDEAGRQLAETKLLAPFDGVVTAVGLEAGEWAQPGRPVIELAGLGSVEVEVQATETVVAGLGVGQKVVIRLPLAKVEVPGRVASFATAAHSGGGLFSLVVELDQHPLAVPGAAAEVIIEKVEKADKAVEGALAVPVEAVVNPGSSRPTVFVVRSDRVHEVGVDLGTLGTGRVTVIADLAVGDEVVVAGHTLLSDGDRVVVRR